MSYDKLTNQESPEDLGIYNDFNKTTFANQSSEIKTKFQERKKLYDTIMSHLNENIRPPGVLSTLSNWFYSFLKPTEDNLQYAIAEYNQLNTNIKTNWPAYKSFSQCSRPTENDFDSTNDFTKALIKSIQLHQDADDQSKPSKLQTLLSYLEKNSNSATWEDVIANVAQDDYVTQQFIRKLHAIDPTLTNPFPKKTTFDFNMVIAYITAMIGELMKSPAAGTAYDRTDYSRIPTETENQLQPQIKKAQNDNKRLETLDKYLVAKSIQDSLKGELSWYEVCEIATDHPNWNSIDAKSSNAIGSIFGTVAKKVTGKFSLKSVLGDTQESLPLKTIQTLHMLIQSMQHNSPSNDDHSLLKQIAYQLRQIKIIPDTKPTLETLYNENFKKIQNLLAQMTNLPSRGLLQTEINLLKTAAFTAINIKGLDDYVTKKEGEATIQTTPNPIRN